LRQPDGTVLNCLASGDEFYNWLHNADGYTIIPDPRTGWYTYALKTASGDLTASPYIAGRIDPKVLGLEKWLKKSPEVLKARPAAFEERWKTIAPAPKTGTINNLIIFIRFSGESEFTNNISDYDANFNSGVSSMKSYFKEASYNALTVTAYFYPDRSGSTVVSYQDSHARSYFQPYNATTNTNGYQGGSNGTDRTNRERALLKAAVDSCSSQIVADGLNVDGDNDGLVDNVCFIASGSAEGWNDLLWPHAWSLNSVTAYIGSKRVDSYNFQMNEISGPDPSVLCHEMGHTLGAPDFYRYYNKSIKPIYIWDVMASNLLPTPQNMSAYTKYKYMTWISSMPKITADGTYTLNPVSTSSTNNCYRIDSPKSTTEYFVVEYRKLQGFDAGLPAEGLLVYRVNTAVAGNSNGPPDELYVFRPGGTTTSDGVFSAGWAEVGKAAFSSTAGRTAFDGSTDPACFLNNGGPGGFAISNIGSSAGDTISFTVKFLDAVNLPTLTTIMPTMIGQTTAISGGDVTADGGAPVIARGVCWNTASHPTTANSKTTDGSGIKPFMSSLTGLKPSTMYYIRAYATNILGTAYGDELGLLTLAFSSITVTSPNGGESWVVGSSHDITWTTVGTVGNVKIEYSTDGGTSYTTIASSISPNSGIYPWTVPSAPSTKALVRITQVSGDYPSDVSDAVFTINAPSPTISLSHTRLNYGAIVGGVATAAQTVIVGNSGGGTLNWTAASNQTRITVAPISGTGTGILQVSVNPASLTAGAYQGTITISAAGATNSPQTIAVNLTVKAAGTSAVPFGDFATPLDGTTGITGAIPVTGWVLDDVETASVQVKRAPHSSDPPAAIGPDGLVFIGNGIFVEGARPDVETGYPDHPFNYRAGWGYMLLTNFLPLQGNDTFTLYAIAADKEGNTVTLGTKTITCDNAHATKPFGTIDTPAQGGDAAGNPFLNFGWVLTPKPKTVPKNGSTIDVYVDSVKAGNLATAPNVYDQYRVDVATAFPGLNNSGGSVGAFYLDTTKYANGVHTIFWIAMDDAGAADGIGSRYFNILNTGAAPPGEAKTQNVFLPPTASIESLPTFLAPLSFQRGFRLSAPRTWLQPDDGGTYHLELREVERIELGLDPEATDDVIPLAPFLSKGERRDRYFGYMVVGDELRPPPIGSTLDPRTGTFSWLPGPGFVGAYDLVFVKADGFGLARKIPVRVTIKPKLGITVTLEK